MNINHLNDNGVHSLLAAITVGLLTHDDPETKRHLLDVIVNELDELDNDDAFGTEGWKHAFGVED